MAELKADEIAALSPEALAAWLAQGEISPDEALQALRHPAIRRADIEMLIRRRELHTLYEFRLEATRHPHSPAAPAVQLLRSLYWRDQFEISHDPRATPIIRHTAITLLQERIPEIALGQRISLARIASPELIPAVMQNREEIVLAALLDNPRLHESTVVRMLEETTCPPTLVAKIARHHRWSASHRVRQMLVRDARLPNQAAMRLMKSLPETELQLLEQSPAAGKLRTMTAGRLRERKRGK